MTHRTFKQQQDLMRTSRADWYMIAFVVIAYAFITWSAIESLSQADSEREARSARNEPIPVSVAMK